MQKPFFSIIVVSLNPGKELKKTIDSILNQTYKELEIVVKDGCSSDDSVKTLKKEGYFYKNPCINLIEKKDSSIYDGMNQAVMEAKGEYYLFLNCGDYFYDDRVLEEVTDRISCVKAENVQKYIYYGNLYNRKLNSHVMSAPEITEFTLYRNVPCHQVCFYHHSLFMERAYESQYKVRADYEHFLYCVYHMNAKPAYLELTVASYEGGGFSETKTNISISKTEHEEITLKYLGKTKCLKYKLLLLLTLAPLRTLMADNPLLSKGYNKVKEVLYKRL